MKCVVCGCDNRPLHRTGPIGGSPDWTCQSCIEKSEPELAKNLKDEFDFMNDLDEAINPSI